MSNSPLIIIIGIAVVFLGGLTQGLTGFGFGLVTVPILVIFLVPQLVVPIVLLTSMLLTFYLLIETRRWLELKRILVLMAAGVAGLPFGIIILKQLDADILRVFIGIIIVLFGLAFLLGYRREIKNERLASVLIGFVSGLLSGSTSLSGPPVILFFTNQGLKKQTFRANIVAYFTVLSLVTLPAFIFSGLITPEVIELSLWFLPAMILGAFLGIKLSHRVNETLFRRITLVIVIVAGFVTVLSASGILR
ncbi:sulfite exporter TauE/SafE family protein [bacterium]|nr:sulfite exporter TauE/SafE family protein [bacterium]